MRILKSPLQIAIDGPVAAGKGTVSKLLAEKLAMLYVDTGAMYRALTFWTVQHDTDLENETAVCDLLTRTKPKVFLRNPLETERDSRLVTVLLNEEDISWQIRTEDISRGVSLITRYKCVRDYMVPQQQRIAATFDVVMEGRDITTRVLPNADLKIYMDASPHVRAQRRYQQVLEKGELVHLKAVEKDLMERDYRDMHRDLDPLTKAADAWHLDTSSLTLPEVVETICQRLVELKLIENT